MTVGELARVKEFAPLSLPAPDREIFGAYSGDLLSWVMGRAEEDNAWLTIMSNVNVVAVASLADVSCVILTEGVTLEGDVLRTAQSKGINVLTTPLSSYEAAVRLSGLLS